MRIGIPKEIESGETRVAASPETARKFAALGLDVAVESSAGEAAGFRDADFTSAGAQITDALAALGADIVIKIAKPRADEIAHMKQGALLACLMNLCEDTETPALLARQGVNALAVERIPRISRAQNMDVLSSQANISGYRAVIEAAALYGRFLSMMMTSAGSAKPARFVVLGAGVAGLQAIATARRLGAQVWAYDVRPEVKEQIQSLGAKPIEIEVGESGAGTGGYAKELSEEGKRKQQALLSEELKKADIIVSTALIPCRKAPVLITGETVQGMRAGSVIVDMAAATGGNCPLTEQDRVVVKHGVTLCGITNFAARVPSDASSFFARNLYNLLALVVEKTDNGARIKDLTADEITAAALVTLNGAVRTPAR